MYRLCLLVALGAAILTLPASTQALTLAQTNVKQQAKNYLNLGAEEAGLKVKDKKSTDFRIFIAEFVKFCMVAFGMIFIILVIVAGYFLLTARGDEDQVKKAITTIQGAVIGLFIILSAWSIATFVAKKARQATNFGSGLEQPK